MAQFSYDRSRATADRLIARFGREATLHEDAPGQAPTGRPYDRPGAAAPRSRVLVGTTVAVRTEYSRRDINGTTILAGDARLYLSAAAGNAVPVVGMSVVLGSESYEIVAVMPISPSGEPVCYEVQGRS